MNFIGSNCNFNNILRERLTVDCTVVSNVDGDYSDQMNGEHNILILPINSLEEYNKHTGLGMNKMIDSGFYGSMQTYTAVYVYMLEHVDIELIIDTINNFDKRNLVDNIWIYPKLDKMKFRDNTVENLPWQKRYVNPIVAKSS